MLPLRSLNLCESLLNRLLAGSVGCTLVLVLRGADNVVRCCAVEVLVAYRCRRFSSLYSGLAAMVRVRSISLPQAGHKFLRSGLSPRIGGDTDFSSRARRDDGHNCWIFGRGTSAPTKTTSGDGGNQLKLVDRTIDGTLNLDA